MTADDRDNEAFAGCFSFFGSLLWFAATLLLVYQVADLRVRVDALETAADASEVSP